MGVDCAGGEGWRLALRAHRLGALIAFKDSPFGRASRSMRPEEETSSERRPGAPQRLPTRQLRRFPIRGRIVTTTGKRRKKFVKSQDCKLPGGLQLSFTGIGYRDFPSSFTGVRISHCPYNRAFLVLKVKKSLETSHTERKQR